MSKVRECLRRAALRGVAVFITDSAKPMLVFVKDSKRMEVEYDRANIQWLNTNFPIRREMPREEQRAMYLELVKWDHSFTYRTGDMKYDPACTRPCLLRAFGWASANPDIFE